MKRYVIREFRTDQKLLEIQAKNARDARARAKDAGLQADDPVAYPAGYICVGVNTLTEAEFAEVG